MKKEIAIGVDIGGTSIKGAAVTSEGEVLDVFAFDVDKEKTQEQIIEQLIDEIKKYTAIHGYNKENLLGIGVGIPGTIDTVNGEVIYSNNLRWNHLPIRKMMEEGTDFEVRIINDAKAATLAENKFGAGKKHKDFVLITLGTGVGSGIISNNKLLTGNKGYGAELGHIMLRLDGEPCTCGRSGCFEAYASATALNRDTKRMMDQHQDSLMWKKLEEYGCLSARVAFDAAKEGDKYALEVVDNYCMYLAEGLLDICNAFRPEVIVLSGGIAKAGDFLLSKVVKHCEKYHYGYDGLPKVEIKISELGYDTGKIGAACLFSK